MSWISEEDWAAAAEPGPDKTTLVIVADPDLGTIAEVTGPDGTRAYGADGGRSGSTSFVSSFAPHRSHA